jgi:ADP-heptose:LPS heptosyltransferase
MEPRHVLIIRMHAIGDVAIVLPYAASLAALLPDARIDFLTSEPAGALVSSLTVFNTVYSFPHCEFRSQRAYETMRWSALIRKRTYDDILDMQSNWVTSAISRMSGARRRTSFDRFGARPAGLRVQDGFQNAGFPSLKPSFRLPIKESIRVRAREILAAAGWNDAGPIVLLNPAGLWETRNWPLEYYESLARMFLDHERSHILFLGTDRIHEKAGDLTRRLGVRVMNLTGQTTLAEALGILQFVSLAVSEDSGLMHMAWVSGVPTVALFGSSHGDWSTPLGPHTRCLHSGDLECRFCMSPVCRYGDVHCLTRHTPDSVYDISQELMKNRSPE